MVAPRGHRLLFTQLSWLREGGSTGEEHRSGAR